MTRMRESFIAVDKLKSFSDVLVDNFVNVFFFSPIWVLVVLASVMALYSRNPGFETQQELWVCGQFSLNKGFT